MGESREDGDVLLLVMEEELRGGMSKLLLLKYGVGGVMTGEQL